MKKSKSTKSSNILMEPFAAEVSAAGTSNDSHLLISQSRNGINMRGIKRIMQRYDLSQKEMAVILNVSERTLQRYADDAILSKDSSERALHLQRLFERGKEVFGTADIFLQWMRTPNLIYKNHQPFSYLDTIFGFELLENELGRIEHGVLA